MIGKYDSYKDSGVEWIGEIPINWETKNLKLSFQIQKGKIPKNLSDSSNENSLPYLSMNILRGGLPEEFTTKDDGVFVQENDIGILWDGSNSGEIIKINQDGILSSTVSRLSLIDNSLEHKFSFYLLKFLESDFKNNTIGMGIPHVDGNYLKYSKLIIPTLYEQQQIVSFLDTKTSLIDSLIEITQKKIDCLKEQRTTLINQLVTNGLNPDVEMKDSGVEWIGEIPNHWRFIPTKYFTYEKRGVQTGPFGTQLNTKDYVKSGVKVMNQKTLIYEDYSLGDEYISYEKYSELEGFEIIGGDLIMGTRGSFGNGKRTTFGKVSIVPDGLGDCVLHPCLVRIRLKEEIILKRYYCYYINDSTFFLDDVRNTSNSTTIEVIYGGTLKDINIPVPPLEEQHEIVKFLDKKTNLIDSTISIEVKRIEQLKEYRQSLISEVVTGKIKVTE